MDPNRENNQLIDHLLFRSLKGDTSPPEEQTVDEWRQSSPDHESYYREMARLLELTREAGADVDRAIGSAPAASEILRTAGTPVAGHEGGTGRDRHPGRRIWWFGGLGVAAAAVLAFISLGPDRSASRELLSFGVDEFATGPRDVATVQLRDGSVVRLAPNSRLRLGGSRGERSVTLNGRAYFAVVKLEGHPFTVRTGGGDVAVLGTRFEAEARGAELRLLVVEGRVALSGPGRRIELGAGQMARAVDGAVSLPTSVPPADARRLLEWTRDFLVFQRTPIDEVAAELRRRFDYTVAIVGERAGEHTVTAWFADAAPPEVVRVVCKVLAARCTIDVARATIDLRPTPETMRRAVP